MRRQFWIQPFSAVLALGIATLATAAPKVGYLKIEDEYPERPTMPSFLGLGDSSATFRQLVDSIYAVADRPFKLDGLVVRLTNAKLPTTQIEELGTALDRVRATGTKVHIFTEIYGPAELLLGAHADEVIVQTGGAVSFPGLYAEEMFLADALGAIGITPDYVQIGDYKGASEPMSRSEPSPEWNENINQLLDGIYANMRSSLAAGRGLTDRGLDRALKEAFFASPETAIKVGVVDSAVDRMDLDEHLEDAYGGDFDWDASIGPTDSTTPDFASMGFFEAFTELMTMLEPQESRTKRDTIAIVHIDGAIIDGESKSGGLLQSAGVGSLTIRKVLADLEDDQNVKGVIIRINSPGGSAIASESIWQGLQRLGEEKPVWASVGTMAASGGYYIAVGTQKIFVDPSSIVGSIGVVEGKLALGGLYKKFHINVVPRTRGPRASIMGGLTPWSDDERALIRQRMTETYEQFVDRVKAGRPGIDISTSAEGRLFTGKNSLSMHMADKIGGIHETVGALADALQLRAGSYDVLDYPPPPSIEEYIEKALPMARTAAPMVGSAAALRELFGEARFNQLRDHLTALLELRTEPVLLTSPRVLLFK